MIRPLRILVADDHDVVRHGLCHLIGQREGWVICGEAANGREAVEQAQKLMPHVVLLDISMPVLNGLEATRQIKAMLPKTEILVFTVHEADEMVREVLASGARGYLLKSDLGKHIIAAIEALAEHKPYFTWKVSKTMLEQYLVRERRTDAFHQLTPREREIIQLLAEGRSNKAVAALLGISVKTVETHRSAIMKKLGISSIAELVRYAIRNNVIQP